MKCIPTIFLCVSAACAADFTNGQAARAVIGQVTFTMADPNSSSTVIGAAGGIAYAANTLFVADDNRLGASPENNRVLLFQNLSSILPAPTAELPYNTKCPVCVGQATVVLGQPDFNTTTVNMAAASNNLRQPTAVASDGIHLVVADTNHNRILIWNTIPSVNDVPADVVVGQPNMTINNPPPSTPSATTMRGPQGVWIQNGRLYVADTQNNRILIFNHIPSTNGAAPDVVLGAPNFTTFMNQDLNQAATAATMVDPVSVTSDGTRLFVTDLGNNRVLIWNSIPTASGTPADVEIGQPDMTGSVANNAFMGSAATSSTDTTNKETPALCTQSNGTDPAHNPTYPNVCNSTLNFPRFALSDGTRLFIADGGNDRVLEFQTIPTGNAASADIVLGQLGGTVDQATDAVDSMNTPTSMAWDGTNLYVSDPYNRRITVYTISSNDLPYQAVVNAASLNIVASGTITIGGTIHDGDVVTATIGAPNQNSINYTYKVQATDAITDVVAGVVNAINAGNGTGNADPNVLATAYDAASQVVLTARIPSEAGNNVTYSASVSSGAQITATAAGANLTDGGGAAQVAPGTLVSINGTNLSSQTAAADLSQPQLPTQLGGAEVYFNGIKSPLLYVSPTQINAQIPWEFTDTTSVNAYVRSVMGDGTIMGTSPVAVTIVPANPGIFTSNGAQTPAIAVATHGSSNAIGIVSVDGTANAGDVATVTIGDRTYNYTVQSGDTLDTIRDNLVALINTDLQVSARAAGVFDRIIITARVAGPEGNTITFGASASSGAQVVMTVIGNGTLCCANVKGAPITQSNPAVPNEVITVYATGLGLPALNDTNSGLIATGQQYPVGAPQTMPTSAQFVSSIAGGSTADVLDASLMPGTVGAFQVDLHLNGNLTTNPYTAITIAQSTFVSNSVTIPVGSQSGSSTATSAGSSSSVTQGPQLTANISAVTNGASFQPGFASATWISIFGTNLSQTTRAWQNTDFVDGSLPSSMDGVSVTINGLTAYVQYVSPTQINVLAPDDKTVGPVQIEVTTAQGKSNIFNAQKEQFAPALFSMSGTNYVAALHADYTYVGNPQLIGAPKSTPAKPGESILIYCTGLGPTSPALPSAQLAPTPAILANSVQVTIGGIEAPVAYAGLVGPGLYQINTTVPNVADGDAPVVAQVGGVQTQTGVWITIQQ
ncbi:MAG TPA: hypothetical protein VKB88_16595 [Bryobacteraceae bacterium]|nr:hypothetical protein [Bryobacteraceae bacterium]